MLLPLLIKNHDKKKKIFFTAESFLKAIFWGGRLYDFSDFSDKLFKWFLLLNPKIFCFNFFVNLLSHKF